MDSIVVSIPPLVAVEQSNYYFVLTYCNDYLIFELDHGPDDDVHLLVTLLDLVVR